MTNEQKELRKMVIDALNSVGAYIEEIEKECKESDIDMREYIADSIMFVSCIVELEERLNIDFPDELLTVDAMSSLNGFVSMLDDILNLESSNAK